jgi:hypothetical protein
MGAVRADDGTAHEHVEDAVRIDVDVSKETADGRLLHLYFFQREVNADRVAFDGKDGFSIGHVHLARPVDGEPSALTHKRDNRDIGNDSR